MRRRLAMVPPPLQWVSSPVVRKTIRGKILVRLHQLRRRLSSSSGLQLPRAAITMYLVGQDLVGGEACA